MSDTRVEGDQGDISSSRSIFYFYVLMIYLINIMK